MIVTVTVVLHLYTHYGEIRPAVRPEFVASSVANDRWGPELLRHLQLRVEVTKEQT